MHEPPCATKPHAMTDARADLQRLLNARIPLTRAMELQVRRADSAAVELWIPLAPNGNDKGTGFAGSLASLATLSGWALTRTVLQAHGIAAEVAVTASELRYCAPATGDMLARCLAPPLAEVQALLAALHQRGRGRWRLAATVTVAGRTVLTLQGRYSAWIAGVAP